VVEQHALSYSQGGVHMDGNRVNDVFQ